jgi:PAS domain S-box-containing protein
VNSGVLRRRRLEHSFAVTTTLLVILVIGATTFVVHNRVLSALKRGLTDRGLAIANSIGAVATPSLLAYNYAALQIAAEGAVEDPALLYVVIHDKEGEIAGVAGSTLYSSFFPSLPEEVAGSMSRQVTLVKENGEAKPVLEAVVPVMVEGVEEPWGVVRVGLGYTSVYAELRRLELGLALSGLILILLAVASSRFMARRITAPLRKLAEGTDALSMGDTSYRIPVSGARELAELGQAFNTMMDRVQEKATESAAYQDQLAQLNATLEEQVSQRTRALEESESQYRNLVEHSPDSILILQGGQVRFINRAFEETFGISEEQALDPDFRLGRIFQASHRDVVAERVRAWERGESPGSTEVVARDVSGNPRELELRGSRIEYRGRPAAECLLVDMTETKRLREKLADTERLRALGELAGGVAHDFNNLLGAILGRIQLLRARGFEPEIDGEMAVVEKAAMDGRETVRRIQEFSRLRTDRPVNSVDLAEIIKDSVEITRTRWKNDAERRNINVEVRIECEPVFPILGNDTELREVYTNLILNAVDAMPQGGSLVLRCFNHDGCVRSEVKDNGVGMPEEIRRHLFDPFFTTKGHSGTGLGMSVAYGIVTRHEGTIEVGSSLGDGTTFTLDFPACEMAPKIRGGDGAAMPPLVRPGRILVIDDEQPIAQLLEDALTGDGHSVEIAVSGRQGVEMAAVSDFDLVMTDLGMPDMSGWEVANKIRSTRPGVPVVLVTGWGTTLDKNEVERYGISAVVHKPFEINELLETANMVLHRHAQILHEKG